jgi:hypothetical protein
MRKLLFLFLISSAASAQNFITNNGIQITNSTNVVTNGDWNNASGTIIKNDGSIITSDSWTNNGTLTGTGGFVLNYATDKNFKGGSPSLGFLTKKGAGAALVTGTIYVADSLFLVGGTVKLNATDTVWIKNNCSVTASPASYIEGTVANSGTGDKLFPLGLNGNSLPLKLIKFDASKATASVVAAPAGYTAGGGVEALINFPYVWKISEKIAADTSAYVEVQYPNTLPTATNPIIVREVPGLKYASMGARAFDNSNGVVTVRSYSRGLKGTFTVAKGFPVDPAADLLALTTLYNKAGGASWTNKTNWLTAAGIDTWFGVTVTGQSITAINLPNNKLTGAVTELLVDIASLQTLNLATNAITAIPNFSDNKQITTLNVSGNKLEFSSLEPNAPLIKPGIAFNYSSQSDIGTAKKTLVDVDGPFTFTPAPESKSNSYLWKRNGVAVSGATLRPYSITKIGRANMGVYVCEVTNSLIPGLTLKTAPETALAAANLDGKLFGTSSTAASKGKMFLFKVNQGTAYDTIAIQNVANDGAYKFEKVVLDDYQLLGFSDTLAYKGALPTYYQNTIYWEEANTIPVNENRINLNITSNYKPTNVAKGVGIISGYLEEPVAANGKVETAKRVSGAGASVRRVEAAGKPTAEKLTLVAYVFTNDLGEFVIPDLPKGEYRLNIQYPGYPMDDKSFITIPIGDGLQSQVRVAANVEAGKIKVDKLVVTGLWEQVGYKAELFPNPTVSSIHLEFGVESSRRFVQLVDLEGREILKQDVSAKNEEVNVSTLSSGIYILNVFDNDSKVKALRVIVEK